MWLLSKTGLITVAAYLGILFVSGTAVEHFETDLIAIPVWGWLLSLPGSVIVGTPGHIYYAVAFNAVTLYLVVAFVAAHRRKRRKPPGPS